MGRVRTWLGCACCFLHLGTCAAQEPPEPSLVHGWYDKYPKTCKEAGRVLHSARQKLQSSIIGVFNAEAHAALRAATRACPEDPALLDEVGEGLRYIGMWRDALQVYSNASRRGVWQHPLQRSVVKGDKKLPSAAIISPDAMEDMPELRKGLEKVQRHLRELRKEFLHARRSGRSDSGVLFKCPEGQTCWETAMTFPNIGRNHEGTWLHHWVKSNRKDCDANIFPVFCGVLEELRNYGLTVLQAAITEVKSPRTYIPLHRSLNTERYRLLCPFISGGNSSSILTFPGFGRKVYRLGECFWFDESFEHELDHVGAARSALFVDVNHPGLDGRPLRQSWSRRWRIADS